MVGYKPVECQSLEKDEEKPFVDNREPKFVDDRDKCLCFRCFRVCKVRNEKAPEELVLACDAIVYDFQGEYNRKIKHKLGVVTTIKGYGIID